MSGGAQRATLAVAVLALTGLLPGCGRKSTLAPVGAIVVHSSELAPSLAEVGIDGRVLTEATRSALSGAGFPLDEGARRHYRATLTVVAFGMSTAREPLRPAAEVVVDLELEQSWAVGPRPRETGRAQAALSVGGPKGAWREALAGAVRDAAQALALDLRAAQKSTEALVRDLSDGDPRARGRALRALAARGASGTARAVAERVRDPDPIVARAAVDALATFKDPASALPLIEAAQAGDTGTTLRLIPVLAEIGGADVEGYLLTLRSGHADPAVRQAAAKALSRARGGRALPRAGRP
jgi:hypothetical protein